MPSQQLSNMSNDELDEKIKVKEEKEYSDGKNGLPTFSVKTGDNKKELEQLREENRKRKNKIMDDMIKDLDDNPPA